ncbi:MAG: HAD family phosphatase [Nanoarchaeota archaeon]|nr:HAD family phosphatase [Nanoarchaeota archaeon]
MKITALIFDLGNVVLTNDWHVQMEDMNDEFSDYFHISVEDMERGFYAGWEDYKLGKIDEDEFWERFLKTAGAKDIDVAKAKEIWRKHQKPVEGMLELLGKLKGEYKLAAMPNIGKGFLDYKIERFRLLDIFDVIVSSCYSGVAKANRGIYERALKELGCKAGECVFIDDQEKNLVTAREMGMKTILFKDREQLDKELMKMGVS